MPPDLSSTTRRIAVSDTLAGNRLDKTIAMAAPDLSRSRVQALIRQGHVSVDGTPLSDAATLSKSGQIIVVTIPEAVPAEPEAEAIPLDILYEDDAILVIDKPAGMVVHPAAGNETATLVNALIAHCGDSLSGIGGVKRPGIVHRLDKETSGLMVAAKHDVAHAGLSAQFADRSLSRQYQAVVAGVLSPPSGTIDAPIGRDPKNRKRMAVVSTNGKHAITHYETLKPLPPHASLIRCRLETGRTHQIRVHLRHLGHPILGDPVYGPRKDLSKSLKTQETEPIKRQALHAFALEFHHPITGETMAFTSALPTDIDLLICHLEAI